MSEKENGLKRPLKAEFSGDLHIGDLIIECSVLEGGIRVLSYRGTSRALGGSEKWSKTAETNGALELPPFLNKKAIIPLVSEKIRVPLSEPIIYKPLHGGRTAYGVPAELLPDICDVWLKAREQRIIKGSALKIAAKAEILMRGLAHVGIIALVDEATGYQEVRDRNELQLVLKKYISPQLLPWAMRFPHKFYEEMFRLRGWEYNAQSKQKKPMMAGKLTRQLIYDKLPTGIVQELERKNPVDPETKRRKTHHHRWLTIEVGDPHLERQIVAVTTLMSVSKNWRKFESLFRQAFGGQQNMLDFIRSGVFRYRHSDVGTT